MSEANDPSKDIDILRERPMSSHTVTQDPAGSPRDHQPPEDRGRGRNAAQACVHCKSKKIRCDEGTPSCSNCVSRGLECEYPAFRRRRGPGKRLPSKQYIRNLEERLSRMESVLESTALTHRHEDGADDPADAGQSMEPGLGPGPAAAVEPIPNPDASQLRTSPPRRSGSGARSRRHGQRSPSSQGTSQTRQEADQSRQSRQSPQDPSSRAAVPVQTAATTNSTLLPAGSNHKFLRLMEMKLLFDESMPPPSFRSQVFTPLNSRSQHLTYLKDLLLDIGPLPMLLNFPFFEARIRQPTSASASSSTNRDDEPMDVAEWTYVNAATALVMQTRFVNGDSSSSGPSSSPSWAFFKNAYGAFLELMSKGNDELAVQAMLTMALYMQGTANTRLAAGFASMAVGAANTLCFHLRIPSVPSYLEPGGAVGVRNRVFWSTYILDQSLCLASGQSSVQDDEEIEIDFPPDTATTAASIDAGTHANNDAVCFDWFRLRAKLATIESATHKQVYASRRLHHSDDEEVMRSLLLLGTIHEECKAELPSDMRNVLEPSAFAGRDLRDDALDFLLAFHSCCIMIHWSARRHSMSRQNYRAVTALDMPYVQLSFSRLRSCESAAASLGLICGLRNPQYALFWRMIPHALCAILVLLVDAFEFPSDKASADKLRHVGSFLAWLAAYERQEKCEMRRLRETLGQMLCAARFAAAQAQASIVSCPSSLEQGTLTAPMSAEGNPASSFDPEREHITLASILSSTTNPMYVANALIGNSPNRDRHLVSLLAELLGFPDEDNPLAPDEMRPSNNAFQFEREWA